MVVVRFLSGYLSCCINFSLGLWGASLFFKRRGISIFALGASVAVAGLLLHIANSFSLMLVNSLISCSLLIVLILINYMGKLYQRVALGITMFAIILVCEFVTLSVTSFFIQGNIVATIDMTIRNSVFSFLSAAFCAILCLVATMIISVRKKRANIETIMPNGSMLVVPLFSIICLYFILYSNRGIELTDGQMTINICMIIALAILNIVVLIGDKAMYRNYKTQAELLTMEAQTQLHEQLIRQMETDLAQQNSLLHDYKNQLLSILSLVRMGDEGAMEYINSQLKDIDASMNTFTYISCKPLRLLISRYSHYAIEKGIHLNLDISYSDFDFMEYADICTVFANALDNAFDACMGLSQETDKYINVRIFRNKHMVFVITENPCTYVVADKHGLVTSKSKTGHKGIGFKNIQMAVARYGGEVDYEVSENTFKLQLSLPLIRSDKINDRLAH